MTRFLYECPACDKQFKGKGGLIKCISHIDKKHRYTAGYYPINKSKEFIDGEWRDINHE